MLPAVVPTARIWTFHYNANYHTEAPVVDILGVGKVLLQVLQARGRLILTAMRSRAVNSLQEDSTTRPLIFIASCFGGLIITQVI